jgi:hypothetical protein
MLLPLLHPFLQARQVLPGQLPAAWAGELPGGGVGTVPAASLCGPGHITAGAPVYAKGGPHCWGNSMPEKPGASLLVTACLHFTCLR